MSDAPLKMHKFELAGLGSAPFKFIGMKTVKFQAHHTAPVQPGGSCDYCGTGIYDQYWVESADGKQFKVGCDCIAKVGDPGLMKIVSKAEAEKRRAKAKAKAAAVMAELPVLLEALAPALAEWPHPFQWHAAKGFTLLDHTKSRIGMSGASGRAKILKELKAFKLQNEKEL